MSVDSSALPEGDRLRTVSVDRTHMSRVGARPGYFRYLRELWRYRSFILFDSKARIAGKSSTDALGRLWMLLNPILNGATYYFVFGFILGTGRGIPNFIAYLIIGVFMFRYTTAAVTAGSKSITGNRNVVRAFTFPRATLPIAVNVRELLANVPTFMMMFALVLIIPPLEPISWKWFMFFPILALQFLMNLGLGLILSRLVAQWNDINHLISFATRAWLYMSCVFFSADRFEDHPALLTVMHANPMFCVLDMTRDVILYDTWPGAERWIVLGAWSLGLTIIGSIIFWRAEESYGREF